MLAVFLIITLLLNPYYWKSPFAALLTGYQMRVNLLDLQLIDHLGGSTPDISRQVLNLISNLFILPPAISEVANYTALISNQIQVYFEILPHSWGRGLIGGSLQLVFFISGFYVLNKRYSKLPRNEKINIILFLITTLSVTFGVLFFLPLPWQRYFVPIVPLIAVWLGYGFLPISEAIQTIFRAKLIQ